MPARVNGIGTIYLGRRNASSRQGKCEFCGRVTTLTSYDTREFFCVIYIPIIPLTKYRIFDSCASCLKHRRVPLAQFRRQVEQQVAPLRDAVQRAPSSVEARRALIEALLEVRLNDEAERAARDGVATIPNDASLNRMAGLVISQRGNYDAARPFLERAIQLDPSDATARIALGRGLFLQKQTVEAIRHLEEARRLTPGDRDVTLLLAESYMRQERWSDALNLLQGITNVDRPIVRAIAECKKRLGYQLTDVERKASRRWWPFGGKRPSLAPAAPSSWTFTHRSAALVMVAIGILVALMIGLAVYHSTGADVWFDSTVPRTTFIVDGHRLVADGPRALMRLGRGAHHVTVLDNKGKKIEERTITVEMPNVFASVFDNRTYVYNVGGQRVYQFSELEYSTIEGMGGHKESYIAEPFFQVDGVDYMFEAPPQTVEVSSGTTTTRKALQLTDWSLVDYAGTRLSENKFDEAERAFRAAVKWNGCDMRARRGLSFALALRDKADESLRVAREAIAQCPAQTVDGHRAYQEALLRLGRGDDALNEYRAAVGVDPESALNHYLYGRLLGTFDASIAEQRAALRVDPHFGWAHAALGYALLGTGAFDEARHEYLKAMESDQHDENTPLYLAYAAIASKHPEDIPHSDDWQVRWLAALSAHDWHTAWTLYKPRASDESAWLNGVQMYKLARDRDGFEKFVERGAKKKELAWAVAAAHVEDALERGDWHEAIAATDAQREPLRATNHLFDLYAAAAAMMSGDRADATRRLAELSKQIEGDQETGDDNGRIVQTELGALSGSMSEADAVNALHDDILLLKHVYFFLGARAWAEGDAARAKQLFRRSEAQAFDLDFPLLAARRLAGS